VYISGQALVILGGPHKLLQTIYVDDTPALEAVAIDEASGRIAVCGGPYAFVYQPYGVLNETLKVRECDRAAGVGPRTLLISLLSNSGRYPLPSATKMMKRRFVPYHGVRPMNFF
jgi:hypothetical protein